MVHEIGHMFGLEHCIYYECTMNGSNGPFEYDYRPNRTLCPVCLAKLKMNIKFDCLQRYQRMAHVCGTLGFEEERKIYVKILNDAGFETEDWDEVREAEVQAELLEILATAAAPIKKAPAAAGVNRRNGVEPKGAAASTTAVKKNVVAAP